MEILGKFGSAMTGFWWALDERERLMLIAGGLWLTVWALDTLASTGKARERRELVDEVVQELERRAR